MQNLILSGFHPDPAIGGKEANKSEPTYTYSVCQYDSKYFMLIDILGTHDSPVAEMESSIALIL